MWPRYEKGTIFHELFEKQHRVTPKRNKSNKRNTWSYTLKSPEISNMRLWHRNIVPGACNRHYEARNLQIYSFSCVLTHRILLKCFNRNLEKIKILHFLPNLCLWNKPNLSKISKKIENSIIHNMILFIGEKYFFFGKLWNF